MEKVKFENLEVGDVFSIALDEGESGSMLIEFTKVHETNGFNCKRNDNDKLAFFAKERWVMYVPKPDMNEKTNIFLQTFYETLEERGWGDIEPEWFRMAIDPDNEAISADEREWVEDLWRCVYWALESAS